MNDQTEQVTAITSISFDEGHLYGVFGKDHTLQSYPVFVFHPLIEAYAHGEYISFAPYWPKFMQKLLLGYVPVKYFDTKDPRFASNDRSGDPLRPWPQLTYNGWPLYYFASGEMVGTPTEHTTMFVPATADLVPPTQKDDTTGDDGGVGGPPGPSLGP